MNTLLRFLAAVTVPLLLFTTSARALNISEQLILDRYTVLTNGTVEYASGHLLNNGKFRVLSSYVTPTYGLPLSTFWPISGRPILHEIMYEGLKVQGVIPKWMRSEHTFDIGFASYVIVAVKGKEDPNPIPTILQNPGSQSVRAGWPAFFSVDAEPWLYLSYQWNFKKKPLPGRTQSYLTIYNATKTDAGIYTVSVSAGGKPVSSAKALLRVVDPVAVKTPPKSQTIPVGKNAVFRVAVTGTGPFTYQWYKDGAEIAGATKSSFTVRKATPENAGLYTVLVQNELSGAYADAELIVQ